MKAITSIAAFVTLGLVTIPFAQGSATAASEEGTHYSHTELRELVRTAHTPEQYHVLAGYYSQQHASFQQKADEEKKEWDRRSLYVTGPAAKGFRPVDASRNRYQYFVYEADQAATLSSHYQQLEQTSQLASAR